MTEAETILKMIEAVDPADTAKLDEIDLAVAYYLVGGGFRYKIIHSPERITRTERQGDWITVPYKYQSRFRYTRSRDALKIIRPQGWGWQLQIREYPTQIGGYYCELNRFEPPLPDDWKNMEE